MARQLWLLRHAEAEPHGTREDSERRLTERGEAQARAAGAALRRLDADFEAVLFSPKVRAQRTAEIAAEAYGGDLAARLRAFPPLAGGFDAAQALQALDEHGGERRLLLVGHEPDMSNIVAQLSGGSADVKKGGLAVLRLEGAGAELTALLRPRELALIAGVPGGGQ